MSDGIYSALSGALAEQRTLDIVANNVANANTAGYRGDRVAFDEALSPTRGGGNVPADAIAQSPTTAPNPLRFVVANRVVTDQSEGTFKATGNPFDVAVEGNAYLSVMTRNGERYTHAGNFVRDSNGLLSTAHGEPVLGVGDTEIRVPINAGELVIDQGGEVRADNAVLGHLKLTEFQNESMVVKEGHTLFVAQNGANPQQAVNASVKQGFIEMSNINPVASLNELITVNRSFEAFQKVISTFKDLDDRAARDLGSRQ